MEDGCFKSFSFSNGFQFVFQTSFTQTLCWRQSASTEQSIAGWCNIFSCAIRRNIRSNAVNHAAELNMRILNAYNCTHQYFEQKTFCDGCELYHIYTIYNVKLCPLKNTFETKPLKQSIYSIDVRKQWNIFNAHLKCITAPLLFEMCSSTTIQNTKVTFLLLFSKLKPKYTTLQRFYWLMINPG